GRDRSRARRRLPALRRPPPAPGGVGSQPNRPPGYQTAVKTAVSEAVRRPPQSGGHREIRSIRIQKLVPRGVRFHQIVDRCLRTSWTPTNGGRWRDGEGFEKSIRDRTAGQRPDV